MRTLTTICVTATVTVIITLLTTRMVGPRPVVAGGRVDEAVLARELGMPVEHVLTAFGEQQSKRHISQEPIGRIRSVYVFDKKRAIRLYVIHDSNVVVVGPGSLTVLEEKVFQLPVVGIKYSDYETGDEFVVGITGRGL